MVLYADKGKDIYSMRNEIRCSMKQTQKTMASKNNNMRNPPYTF